MDFIDYLETNFSTSRASGGSQIVVEDDCPFCGGPGGKMYVDVKKQVGIDFRCGRGFGPLSFVMAKEGITKAKAKQLLSGLSDRFTSDVDEDEEKNSGWWPQCVMAEDSFDAVDYMACRGFDIEFCQSMGLMYCPTDTEVDGKTYRTANRVIIPIYNREGEPIGWQGRDTTGSSFIKYLIQPGFNAGESLYNIHQVKEGSEVIVCEGVMDAWGWIRAGLKNVVATYGKKISDTQVAMLAGLRPSVVYIAWDGDAADKKYKFAEDYGHIFNIKIVNMGDKDADEMPGGSLRRLLADASSYSWEAKIMESIRT